MSNQKVRVERLAGKIATILYEDIQRDGKLKPNYMSPKFWALVQGEIRRRENKASAGSQSRNATS